MKLRELRITFDRDANGATLPVVGHAVFQREASDNAKFLFDKDGNPHPRAHTINIGPGCPPMKSDPNLNASAKDLALIQEVWDAQAAKGVWVQPLKS